MTTISVAELRAHGICADQLALFRATFGDEAAVTAANMTRAADAGLQIEWLGCLLAAPARAVFEAVRAPALESYRAARHQAWAVCVATCDPAAYEAVRARARAAYRRALVGPLVRALRAEDRGA